MSDLRAGLGQQAPYNYSKVVYIASQFARQAEMRELRDRLEKIPGFKVNAKWLDEVPPDHEPAMEERILMSDRDISDVREADVFILVNPPPYIGGRKELSRGGRMIEAGIAIAIDMFSRYVTLIVIGDDSCIHLHSGRWKKFKTIEEFLKGIEDEHRS